MPGIFMLWIDVELAWGQVHRRKIDLLRMERISLRVRDVLDDVISILEKYDVPAAWSILGHLVLDHCNRDDNGVPHPDMPRPTYSWLKDDWYRFDPCSDVEKAPAWYGKDIVDRIVRYVKHCNIRHDIACHSFSHQIFGDPGCGKELARAEVQRCNELMEKEYGIIPKVFAFPRDYVGHIEVLQECGYNAFRDIPRKLYPCLNLEKTFSNYVKTYFSLFIQFLSYYLLLSPHVALPREPLQNIWSVAGCLAYSRKKLIPLNLVTLKAIKGIHKAIREQKIFCIYTHLRNLAESAEILSGFEEILSLVDIKRKEGVIESKTITEVINELSDRNKNEGKISTMTQFA